ncbi:DNA/RNA non-specific endonuclease [Streptomyces sp. NPDC002476]|uniref:DNA/RNA non-specific endonuclease n=1 Tax=Streptomyces sp. NPDC002476 TaxID=3364648 RepID=UPI0036C9D8C1
MTTNPLKPVARHRRTMRRVIPLVLVAFLGLIIGTGAPASAATSVARALAQPGTVSPLAPSGDITAVSAALVQKIEDFNRQEAEIAQQAKSLVAEAERITKDAAALRTATTAFNSKSAAVDQKASDFNSRAAALNAKISAHNSKPHTFRMPAQAAAANAYAAEANRLRAEQARLRTTKSSLQNEQNQLRKQGSQLRSKKSQLTAASSAHDAKARTLRSKENQLQSLGKQLLQQMAQAIQSLDDNPPDPAAMMDQGGDAAGPPQYRDHSQSQEAGLADSPSRQPQASALKAYAKQTGTTVDMQPGTAYLTPEAVRRLPAAQAAQLGSPVGTYDGLARKPNGHYRALRVQTPGVFGSPGQAAFDAAIARGGQAQASVSGTRIVIDEVTSVAAVRIPSEPAERTPAPTTPPRLGPDTDTDNKQRCESEPKSSRFQYQSLDGEGRAQGATALICPSDLKPPLADRDTGSVDVYGFPDPEQNTPRSGKGNIFDRTHIVGDKVGGDWVNENLFTGFKRMNRSGMRRCEIKMEKQLAAGKWVQYMGKVNYSHTTGYAGSITMSAYTKDGVLFDNVVVKNSTDWQTTC